MKNISKDLKIEIHTTNEIKRVLKLELAHILPLLQAFIGKKIFTLKGRAKAFEIAFLGSKPVAFEGGFAQIARCYFDNSHNTLYLRFCLCFNGGSYDAKPSTAYTRYVDFDVAIGTLENNEKLVSIESLENLISSYKLDTVMNVEEEIKAIETYAALKAQMEEAKRKISVSPEIYKYV